MFKTQMFIAGALLAGVAIGYFAGGHGDVARPADVQEEYVAKKAVSDSGEAASLKALRRRVAELERLLAEKEEPSEEAVTNAIAAAPAPGPGNPQEWLENLKKNDPARYVQMTNRWAQWRRRRAERAQSKIEFLSTVDVSRLGAQAQQTHNELLDLIVRREEIEEEIHREGVTDSERRQLMEEMWATDREMRSHNNIERSNLISMAARNSGVKGSMVKELTATIKDVIEATDSGWGGHHRHGGGPRGPGGPGGR